eukprot:521241_1
MAPWFEPAQGPTSTKNYTKGVTVVMTGGDECEAQKVFRETHLWLQCDPTISTRPATVKIAEADPSNPNVGTTCKYYFEALVHKDFCPGGGGGSSGFDYGWVFVIIVLV